MAMTRKEMKHFADELVGKLLHGHGKMDDTTLDWKDIRFIVKIADDMLDNPEMRMAIQNRGEEAYYTEVLKRFNEYKNG